MSELKSHEERCQGAKRAELLDYDFMSDDASPPVSDRARTPEQKRAMVERLLAAWLELPELRLGQMLQEGLWHDRFVPGWRNGFHVEDESLVGCAERFVKAFAEDGKLPYSKLFKKEVADDE